MKAYTCFENNCFIVHIMSFISFSLKTYTCSDLTYSQILHRPYIKGSTYCVMVLSKCLGRYIVIFLFFVMFYIFLFYFYKLRIARKVHNSLRVSTCDRYGLLDLKGTLMPLIAVQHRTGFIHLSTYVALKCKCL